MYGLRSVVLASWITIVMARPSSSEVPEKPVEGNMHSLRDMVRTKKFHPVDQATLPFQPRPGGQWDVDLSQSKQCSICMATLLDLVCLGRAYFKGFRESRP